MPDTTMTPAHKLEKSSPDERESALDQFFAEQRTDKIAGAVCYGSFVAMVILALKIIRL